MTILLDILESMYRNPLAGLSIVLPALLILVIVHRMSSRIKRLETLQRDRCLREIESAGGFEAWKRIHFPSAIPE